MVSGKEAKQALSAIRNAGLNPALYIVLSDAPGRWIIQHRITKKIKTVEKEKGK